MRTLSCILFRHGTRKSLVFIFEFFFAVTSQRNMRIRCINIHSGRCYPQVIVDNFSPIYKILFRGWHVFAHSCRKMGKMGCLRFWKSYDMIHKERIWVTKATAVQLTVVIRSCVFFAL